MSFWSKLLRPRTPEEYAEKIADSLSRGDSETALALASECATRFPDVPESRLLHADLLASLGRTEEALATLDAVIERYPTTAWLAKARLLEADQQIERALDAYQRAAQSDEQYVDGWLAWARALARADEHDLAIEKLETAGALAPKQAGIQARIAASLMALDRISDALERYERALELGDASAHGGVRSALLQLGRVNEANERRSRDDAQGEACELRTLLSSRSLVARYFTGQHSRPELLHGVVESMLRHIASLESAPPGLSNGTTIQYGWTTVRLWDDGSDLVVCEPDWTNHPRYRARPVVTFSAMHLVMLRVVADVTGTTNEDCSCHQTLVVERGALETERVLMMRSQPSSAEDSGWRVRCSATTEFNGEELPMTALVSVRPELLKVVMLPVGWSAHLNGHEIEKVLDRDGNNRFVGDADSTKLRAP